MSRLIGSFIAACLTLAAADADLILHNGKIVTVDNAFAVRQAVAVKAGKITAVGTDAAVLAERGPNTKVIDLPASGSSFPVPSPPGSPNCRCQPAKYWT